MSGAMTLPRHLSSANKWRSQYNPLRGLTIQRAASLLEEGERGAYADLTWLYRMIEKRHPVLRALKARRLGAIAKLDWAIKTVSTEGVDEALAEDQAAALRAAYDKIDNLRAAIRFLALAEFRGFAHIERQVRGPQSPVSGPRSPVLPSETNHLECVDQWFWCRDGLYGPWTYNADSASGRVVGEPVDLGTLLVREVEDPLNEIALIQYVRSGLSEKDWDAFIEVYGIPRPVVIMPPQVPVEKEAEYKSAAEAIADGIPGALPYGGDAKFPTAGLGESPFKQRLDHLAEQLVLAGTGGKLTMLSGPTGIGQGASGEHGDVFDDIARAEALEISEVFQKGLDALVLAELFPGKPALAYFELAATDEEDVGALVDHAVKLSQAGYAIDLEELSERTGYELVRRQERRPETGDRGPETVGDEEEAEGGLVNRMRRVWDRLVNAWITDGDGNRFFIGKDWREHGRPDIRDLAHLAVDEPRSLSVVDGERELWQGVTEMDPLGNGVRFDRQTMAHFQRPDQLNRAEFLPHAKASVKSPVEIWQQDNNDVYIGLFKDARGMVSGGTVFVVQRRGGAESFYKVSKIRKLNNYRKGELIYAK
jgi:hypothetical protein